MENKLYVGNLSYEATEQELRDLFSQAGVVQSVAIIKDRETGRSKGFAFIEMSTQAEAQAAIHRFNGQSHRDRAMSVKIALPREDRGGFGGGYGGNRGGGGYGRNSGRDRRPGGGSRERGRRPW